MNSRIRPVWLSLALAVSPGALAGEVADLVTFMPGTPARASEVNGNFAALKAAVNDNHTRLTASEATQSALDESLQALESAMASQQTQISALQAEVATLASEIAPLTAGVFPPGVVSVVSHAFRTVPGFSCSYDFRTGRFNDAAGVLCSMEAPVNLPHGAKITAVSCSYYDSDAGKFDSFSLQRRNLNDGSGVGMRFHWNAEPGSATPSHVVAALDDGSGFELIDNSTYAYYLNASAVTGADPVQLQLHGCRIHYEY